ncbi:hypothetical protein D9M71_522330 [compost metagenome]
MGVGREALAAVFLGDDQGKEAVRLDVVPGCGWQVQVLADLPVTDHGAEGFGGAVDEGLFFFAQLGFGIAEQGVPVRAAAEQFAIPPHGAGIDGLAFGLRHRWQGALEPAEQRAAEDFAAQLRQQYQCSLGRQHQPEERQQPAGCVAEDAHQHHIPRQHGQRRHGGNAPVGKIGRTDHQNH